MSIAVRRCASNAACLAAPSATALNLNSVRGEVRITVAKRAQCDDILFCVGAPLSQTDNMVSLEVVIAGFGEKPISSQHSQRP